jgi:ketosteroid isomerase-like protein
MPDQKVALVREAYDAFNRREIDSALERMVPEVEWPNVLEQVTIRGHGAVREYWAGQFEQIDPRVEPEEFLEAGDRLVVVVHQVVRDTRGELLADRRVCHVYAFRDGKISRMDMYDGKAEALEAAGVQG